VAVIRTLPAIKRTIESDELGMFRYIIEFGDNILEKSEYLYSEWDTANYAANTKMRQIEWEALHDELFLR